MGLGKLVHYSVDLVLISMLLAAIRRNTGLQLIYNNSDLKRYITQYLNFGEVAYDKFVSFLKITGYFHIPGFFDRLRDNINDTVSSNDFNNNFNANSTGISSHSAPAPPPPSGKNRV
ncbi:hypothetical protein WICMUC_001509 [Wickerhamomyces mucosus]|uniref:DUF1748-domain-containing protein n=1 Tax=Wickerhamomyces mucosus TaxID=1378264 RepID=A0A9P8PVR3_9ASCO|nr:hypothetical protein WICMUC_001509 [Wickerhamomyces mucosus]